MRGVIERLQSLGAGDVQELSGREENIEFAVPKELQVKQIS